MILHKIRDATHSSASEFLNTVDDRLSAQSGDPMKHPFYGNAFPV